MLALIGGLRGILTAIGGAGIALVLFLAWNAVWDNPRVREAGRQQERIAWEETRRRMLLEMERDRRAAQLAIDEIERQYLAVRDRDRRAIESLETAIAEMEKADEAPQSGCSCPAAIPRGLSRSLDEIGR